MTGRGLDPIEQLERAKRLIDDDGKPTILEKSCTYYIAYRVEQKYAEDSIRYCVGYPINMPFDGKPEDEKYLKETKEKFIIEKLPELKKQHQTDNIKVLKVYTTCEECTKMANKENETQRINKSLIIRKS